MIRIGFSIFYAGINIGATVSGLLCGWLGETYGWGWGFGAAGIGMLAGLANFIHGQKHLMGHAEPREPEKLRQRVIGPLSREHLIYLGALAGEELWRAFEAIGINAVHTGPVKQAGGITGWVQTASIDGHFDRISTQIDPIFGHEDEFRQLSDVADRHGGSVIDDIVPGHTGKGADFRLAEMAYKDYPGIYHMVEIPEEDWPLLPDVPEGRDAVNLDAETEAQLVQSLEDLMRRRTTIIISHRLSTIRKVDRIVVIQNGAIEDIGSHSELMSRSGLYAKLYRMQFGHGTALAG